MDIGLRSKVNRNLNGLNTGCYFIDFALALFFFTADYCYGGLDC